MHGLKEDFTNFRKGYERSIDNKVQFPNKYEEMSNRDKLMLFELRQHNTPIPPKDYRQSTIKLTTP
jgi:hypothetical protein